MEAAMVYAIAFLTALSGAMMPGPLLTITIAQTAKRGFIASVLLVAGHSLLELLLVIGLWFGLGSIMKTPSVMGTVAVIGGFMLLWMGYGMMKDASSISLDLRTDNDNISSSRWLNHPIIAGMVISLSNPYWLIWWATIGLTLFASLSHNALPIIIAFYLGHISGDALWYMAVGGAVATGRRFINPRVYKVIIRVCSVILIILGISFLYLTASGNLWKIKMDMSPLKHKIESISAK